MQNNPNGAEDSHPFPLPPSLRLWVCGFVCVTLGALIRSEPWNALIAACGFFIYSYGLIKYLPMAQETRDNSHRSPGPRPPHRP